jgi:preprotein translocase subunit YajC
MTVFVSAFTVLAAEAGGAAARPQASLQDTLFGLLPIILIFAAFFWLMTRSQKKQQRQRQEMLEGIRPKDDVVTVGGIHGRVVRVDDEVAVLRVDREKDIKITIAKTGIGRKLNAETTED